MSNTNPNTRLLVEMISDAIANPEFDLTFEGVDALLKADPPASVYAEVPGQFRQKVGGGLLRVWEVVDRNEFSTEIKGRITLAKNAQTRESKDKAAPGRSDIVAKLREKGVTTASKLAAKTRGGK